MTHVGSAVRSHIMSERNSAGQTHFCGKQARFRGRNFLRMYSARITWLCYEVFPFRDCRECRLKCGTNTPQDVDNARQSQLYSALQYRIYLVWRTSSYDLSSSDLSCPFCLTKQRSADCRQVRIINRPSYHLWAGGSDFSHNLWIVCGWVRLLEYTDESKLQRDQSINIILYVASNLHANSYLWSWFQANYQTILSRWRHHLSLSCFLWFDTWAFGENFPRWAKPRFPFFSSVHPATSFFFTSTRQFSPLKSNRGYHTFLL